MQNIPQQFISDYFYNQFPHEIILAMLTQKEKKDLVKKYYRSFSDNEIFRCFYFEETKNTFHMVSSGGCLTFIINEHKGNISIKEGTTIVKSDLINTIN